MKKITISTKGSFAQELRKQLANREYDPEEFAKMVREEGGYVMDKFGAMDDDDDEDDEDDEKMGLYD